MVPCRKHLPQSNLHCFATTCLLAPNYLCDCCLHRTSEPIHPHLPFCDQLHHSLPDVESCCRVVLMCKSRQQQCCPSGLSVYLSVCPSICLSVIMTLLHFASPCTSSTPLSCLDRFRQQQCCPGGGHPGGPGISRGNSHHHHSPAPPRCLQPHAACPHTLGRRPACLLRYLSCVHCMSGHDLCGQCSLPAKP